MGKLNVQFAPVEDKGTGEVSHAVDPTTYDADDVTNESTGDVTHAEATTYTADAVVVESTGESEQSGPTTTAADWPPHGEDKAISTGEAKAAPSKKAPAKAAATKKKGA